MRVNKRKETLLDFFCTRQKRATNCRLQSTAWETHVGQRDGTYWGLWGCFVCRSLELENQSTKFTSVDHQLCRRFGKQSDPQVFVQGATSDQQQCLLVLTNYVEVKHFDLCWCHRQTKKFQILNQMFKFLIWLGFWIYSTYASNILTKNFGANVQILNQMFKF